MKVSKLSYVKFSVKHLLSKKTKVLKVKCLNTSRWSRWLYLFKTRLWIWPNLTVFWYSVLQTHFTDYQKLVRVHFTALLLGSLTTASNTSDPNKSLVILALRELELSSMSGPFERQGIHIPEPERPAVVMAAPLAARPHAHHSAVPQQYGLSLKRDDKLPRWADLGGSVFSTDKLWKGKYTFTRLASFSFRYDCYTVSSSDSAP